MYSSVPFVLPFILTFMMKQAVNLNVCFFSASFLFVLTDAEALYRRKAGRNPRSEEHSLSSF